VFLAKIITIAVRMNYTYRIVWQPWLFWKK